MAARLPGALSAGRLLFREARQWQAEHQRYEARLAEMSELLMQVGRADAPDAGGGDDSAYRPAQEILDLLSDRLGGFKALHSLLRSAPWIRRAKPTPQRLVVHVGDLVRALAVLGDGAGVRLADLTADDFEAWRAEVEARKVEVARKRGAGR
jgi:hypothetical protein